MNRKISYLYRIALVFALMTSSFFAKSQINKNDSLMFGAEIFIEPGQTDENIESWFKTLSDNHMYLTRIRMFENYMKDDDGSWDFSLFDKAFKYGEKYNIKIYANLFPATDFTDVGGFKFPYNREHLDSISNYIKEVVLHFNEFKSLYGWVPINEPGGGNINDALAKEIFAEWKYKNRIIERNNLQDTHHFSFERNQFTLYYNTWYLNWLTNEIRKYDKDRPIHVNTHSIFDNVTQYDFPAWSKFLTSLGGSAHASWHFGYFPREKYSFAMSANSEIILSGAKDIPWLMTELQGGNNIYSGNQPLCPTEEEIAQWLWISVATGSKGAIFWCLNPRMSGTEAGEWAMVDFQNEPTNRLIEVGKIAKIIGANKKIFSEAKPLNSKINILYNRESLWVENRMTSTIRNSSFDFRNSGAVMKSVISYFEALSQIGLQPTLKEFNEFNFNKDNYSGETIILAHQVAIPKKFYDKLRHFVNNGGNLIVDGLTGFYNENAISVMVNNFPHSDLFGGNISEYYFEDKLFDIKIDNQRTLPTHALKGLVKQTSGEVIRNDKGENIGIINKFGKGKVMWTPSLIGLGARLSDNYEPLINLIEPFLNINDELRFESYMEGVLMKNLQSGEKMITVLINKSKSNKEVILKGFYKYNNPEVIYRSKNTNINEYKVSIDSDDTLVILWNQNSF